MLRTLKNFSILLNALLLGACAGHMSYSEMNALMPVKPADKGRIFFYRPSPFIGNLITPPIELNGKPVGVSNPGTFFYVDSDPGTYQVACGNGDQSQASFTLAAGEDVYVRTKVGGGSLVKSSIVTEVIPTGAAIPEIHGLNYDSTH
jgi:hypothetical protein